MSNCHSQYRYILDIQTLHDIIAVTRDMQIQAYSEVHPGRVLPAGDVPVHCVEHLRACGEGGEWCRWSIVARWPSPPTPGPPLLYPSWLAGATG